MTEFETVESEADKDYEALLSPMPTIVARSLRDDPNYAKCPRCWHMHTVLTNHDKLCDRCCITLIQAWPDHESVPLILACRETQRQQFYQPKPC
jgi:hypothetical protein